MRLYKSQQTADVEAELERAQDWDEIYEEANWDTLFSKHRKDLEDALKELSSRRAIWFTEYWVGSREPEAIELRKKWIELHEAAIARMRETSL